MKKEQKKRIRLALAAFLLCGIGVGGSGNVYASTYSAGGGSATGAYAVAIGSGSGSTDDRYGNATASGEYAVAIGAGASAGNLKSVAIGRASVTGNYGVSIGDGSSASGAESTALGSESHAGAANAAALGSYSNASKSYSVAVGAATASAEQAVAIGRKAKASGTNAVAIGGNSEDSKGAQASSTSATAVGDLSSASETYATALGYSASASGNYAISLGDSSASKEYTFAVGKGASASEVRAIAIGSNTTASGTNAVAIGGSGSAGYGAKASGNYSISLGYYAISGGTNSVTVGQESRAYGYGSLALGSSAVAGTSSASATTDMYATAVGSSASASNTYATAMGYIAKAVATNAVALGKSAAAGKSTTSGSTTTTTGASAVALGDSASAEKDYSMALGYSSSATGDNAISIGDSTASESGTIAVGRRTKASGLYGIAIGSGDDSQETLAYGASSVAVGRNAKSYGGGSVAYGFYAFAGSSSSSSIQHATALGSNAEASNTDTVALGYSSEAKGSNAISIGNSSAGADDAIAIGQSANATLGNAIALGKSATASVADTIAIGESASAGGAKGVAIGQGAQAGSANAVALGDSSVTSEADSVSVGASTSKTRTITNVTAGDSTKDAAIWDQIAATGKTVELSTDTRDTVGTKTVKKNEIAANDGTVLATFKTMTSVAENDTGFVSGDDLYTELRPSSGNYISDQATKTNLSALDTAIGKTADGNYISEQNGTSVTVATNLKALDDAIGAKLSDDGNYILKANTVVANLSALDTKIGAAKGLTGVYEASDDVETQIQNTAKKTIKSVSAATSSGDAAKVQTSTITYSDDSTIAMTVAGEGSVAESDVRLISGATLYTETRPVTSTNYIASGNTTAVNLSALDAAIGAKTAGEYIAAGDTDTVYTNLAALDTKIGEAKGLTGVYEASDDVETQIQNTAKKTIKSVSAATSSNDAGKVQTSTITYSDDSTITMAVAGEGSVAEMDVRLISGATLYTETRPVTSTNYIASGNTTAANLSALDAAIGAKTAGKYIAAGGTDTVYTNLAALDTKIGEAKGLTGVYEASDDVETQIQNTAKKTIKSVSAATSSGDAAKVQTSTITYSDDSTITMAVAGEGSVAETDVRLISGATLYTETRPVTSTNYIASTNTTAANLSALDAAIGAKASGSYIKAGNTDTVYRNLSALDAAIGAVDTVGNYILKSRDETGGPSISMATNIEALDKAIGKTTGGYHISAQNGTSTTVATNLKELDDAIGEKASGNYISDGDTATVYTNLSALDTAIGAKASGNYISDGDAATVYSNLSAIDTAIGAKASGNYISNADTATVYSNLSALDAKIGVATGGTNYDAGDTVETQIYKVDQSGVKNKVYTFDTETGIATIETNASTDTDQKTAFQLKLASNGSIAVKDGGLISGEKVYAEVRPTDALYVKEAKTAAANLNVLDTALGSVDTDGNYISKSRNDAGAPVVSLAANVAALDTAIGAKASGSYIKAGNTDTVYSNLSLLDTAVGAVDTVGNYILKSRDENGAPVTSMATNIAALDKAIGKTTGGNYLSAQNGRSTTVATNLKELDDAIGARASGNYISDGDKATVYSNLSALDTAIGKTAGGNYISAQDGTTVTVATNLKALDDAIGTRASGNYISDADTATVYSNISALDAKIGVATGGTNYAAGDTVETQIYKVDQKALQEGQTFKLDSTMAGKTALLKANDKVTTLATITMSVGSISLENTGFVDGGTVYAYVLPKAEDGQTLYTVSTEKTTGENLARLDKKIGTAQDETDLKYVKDADSVSENLVSLDRAIVDAEKLVYQDDAHVIHVGETLGGTEVSFAGADGTRTLSGISQGAGEGEAATWDQIVAPGQFLYASEAKVGDKAKNSLYDNSGNLLATLQLGTVSSGSDGFVSGGTVYDALVKNDTYTVSYTTGADGSKSGSFTVLTNDGETAFTVNGILSEVGDEETTPYVPYTGDNETIAIDEKSHKISAKIGEVLSDSTGLLTGQTMYAELRPKEAGTYVNGGKTTAENISALDEKTAEQAESIETLTDDMEIQKKLLSQTGDTVSVAEGVHATDISFASAGGETRILTGISKGTASGNAAVWDQIAKENQFIYAVDTAADDGHQKNIFYDNVGNALATFRIGTVSSGSDGFVSGGAVYNALVKNDTYTVKYGVGMDGLTTGTIEVLRNDGSVAFTVSGIQTGSATGEATPYTPYTGDNETITINSDTHKISAKTGTIGEGDSGLVTGGAVYSELRPKEDGRYVSGQKTTAENLKSLDTQVGTNTDAIVKIQTRVESHEKLVSQEGNTIRVGGDASITADTVTVASSGGDTRKLTGISKGTAESDAVNFSQIGTVTGKNVLDSSKNIAGNLDLIDEKIGTIADGTYQAISADATISENLIALDRTVGKTVVPDIEHLQDITKSEGATSKGGNSLALGNDSHAEGESSISFGTGASATSENSISIGKGSTVSGTDSIAVGTGHSVHGNNSGTFGDPSEIHGNNSYALGNTNVIGDHAAGDGALGNNSFIVGNNSTVTGDHTFVLGNNVTTSANHSVVLGDNSTAKEDNVVSVGDEGSERRIVNVAAGVKDTDAVNMSQLRAQLGGNVEALRSELTTDIRAVAAGAAALAALHPGTYDPNDKLSFAVGYGHYRDANAGALGAFYKPNEDILVSLGGTIGNGNPMMNAGISFKLGQRGKAKELYRTPSEMAREMKRLIEDNKALKTDNTAQAKKIDAQAEKIDAQAKQIDTQSKKIESLEADNQKMKAQIEKILQKLELSDTVEKSAVGK